MRGKPFPKGHKTWNKIEMRTYAICGKPLRSWGNNKTCLVGDCRKLYYRIHKREYMRKYREMWTTAIPRPISE